MGYTATIGTKGQIVIPAEVRHQFGLEPGQKVQVICEGQSIQLRPIPKNLIRALKGSLKGGPSMLEDLMREHAEEVQRDAALSV